MFSIEVESNIKKGIISYLIIENMLNNDTKMELKDCTPLEIACFYIGKYMQVQGENCNN